MAEDIARGKLPGSSRGKLDETLLSAGITTSLQPSLIPWRTVRFTCSIPIYWHAAIENAILARASFVNARIISVVSIGVAALLAVWFLTSIHAIPPEIAPSIIYSLIVLVTGVWLTHLVSNLVLRGLQPTVGHPANTVRNAVRIIGYAIVVIIALSIFGVTLDVALAGGTVTGLVLGLGAQLVLSNFFAGLVILTTGFVKAGDEVRLLNSSIPYQAANLPAYKYFSADNINIGYRGRIVEVGLMFSSMITDTGLGLKVPNQMIFNSAIVDYRPTQSGMRILQVRYEFSIDYDPDEVLARVRESLSDIKQVQKIMFNEQSDKQYLIVLVEFAVTMNEDWTVIKSEMLRRLAKVHRNLAKS